ncbi:general secretion pathway protein A [Geobacter sp. DSM 9736]|nr:general secretion pathway protein A [Geobacter sp. DSM 9736]
MYCSYYGFREKPFNLTPDPGFIFLGEQHREAFAHLLYGIDSHTGFISLTGEVGTGKTTVIRTLLGQLSADRYRTAIIFNPSLSTIGLMQAITKEFGLPVSFSDTTEHLLDRLNNFLLQENESGRTVVLVIDEAQNLAPQVLEQVRLISNLETERHKLIQIVLVGQPELRDLLSRRELRQLKQRIGVSCHLNPMKFQDTRSYVDHRLGIAGRSDGGLFSPASLRRIHRFSGGIPRLVNLACDRALLLGYSRGKVPITGKMADIAITDLRKTDKRRIWHRRGLAWGGAVLCIALATAFLPDFLWNRETSTPAEAVIPDRTADLQRILAAMTANESAAVAFNAMATCWSVQPLMNPSNDVVPEQLARERGLRSMKFTGDLATLERLDSPALLELSLPTAGTRYLALTNMDDSDLLTVPQLPGNNRLTKADLAELWTGRAFIFWRNYLEIPTGLKEGARPDLISRLQGLLKGSGTYSGPLNGKFDSETISAIKTFQRQNNIEETGTAGQQTLILLYRSGGGFSVPSLHRKEKVS